MMSQQQNPPAPEMGSEKTNAEADVKRFSIRQYALASRHRSIFHSWPFPEKYLHMCLNRGLRDVLPPFGPQTSPSESLKSSSNLVHSRDDSKGVEFCKAEVPHPQNIKNECSLFSDGGRCKVTNHTRDCTSTHEEGNNQHNCSVSVNVADAFSSHPSSIHAHKTSPTTLASSKAVKDKRRRRRGRCKKRSMVDILAVARHCTLEEIYRMNKFFYAETVTEGCQQMGPFENVSKSELRGEENSCRKVVREDQEVADIGITGKGTLLLKFKLNGCNVNQNCGTCIDSVE